MQTTKELIEQLYRYSEAYYQGNTLIDDESFDALEDELRRIDPQNEYFKKNRESAGYGTKYPHIYEFVGSIDKIHTLEESKLQGKVSLSAKLDGTSMVAYYKDGQLVHALTRGDGETGLDITQHYEVIVKKNRLSIPKNFTGAVRGEVIFSNMNWEMFKSIHPEAKMPRNSGTGLINQKTVQPEADLLDYVTYDIIASSIEIKEVFSTLQSLGFITAPHEYKTAAEITEDYLKQKFDSWKNIYPLDGIVIRKDEMLYNIERELFIIKKQQEAFKFQAETKLCKVTGITWGMGRTGKMIPVIQIEPTELSGALVTNITGHNAGTILDKCIGVGSQITVRRSGEVIPYLDEVITRVMPTVPVTCPHCMGELDWTETKVDLICTNENCIGQQYKKMANYILTMCKDIKGVGDSFIEGFIKYFGAIDIKDLLIKINQFRVEDRINTLGDANNKIAQQVIALLKQPQQNTADFLQALGIRFLGNSFASEIANSVECEELFMRGLVDSNAEITKEKLLTILPGRISLADSVVNSLPQISAIVNIIYMNGQYFRFIDKTAKNGAQQRYYAVTGAVSKPRKEFEAELLSKNWKITETISKAVVLINNDTTSNSAKNLKAREAGKPIISEEDFRNTYL